MNKTLNLNVVNKFLTTIERRKRRQTQGKHNNTIECTKSTYIKNDSAYEESHFCFAESVKLLKKREKVS